MTLPTLSLVIPCGPSEHDERCLQELLKSIDAQDYPKDRLEVYIQRNPEGPEYAKARGIQKTRGEIIGLLCTDNVLIGKGFLRVMASAAYDPSVVGAFTRRYHYDPKDTLLDRYFALLGANDPVCWWLGKADRESYLACDKDTSINSFEKAIPSIGDNGCFYKTAALKLVSKDPSTYYVIDACEDLRRLGFYHWAVVASDGIAHKSGQSFWVWLRKRWRYVNELYWRDLPKRRWVMVRGFRDWVFVAGFALASLMVLPHLWVSLRGYRQLRNSAWFLHPTVCGTLTLLYATTWLRHLLLSLWQFAASGGRKPLKQL